MPIEFTQPASNGYDDFREVAYQPHHVRALQAEVTTGVNECLQELDYISEMLRTLEAPFGGPPPDTWDSTSPGDATQPMTGPAPVPAPPAPTAGTAYAETDSSTDFDARLANLKRLLAEKLTEDELLE